MSASNGNGPELVDTEKSGDGRDFGTTRSGGITLVLTISIWIAFAVLGNHRYRPPAPLTAVEASEAGEDRFSAERADRILEVLVGDGIPHPAGSQQNNIVRQRIVEQLESWGYDVLQQETENRMLRQPDGKPVPLVNIMARLPGLESGPAIMLAAHYDSRTGPGASDDGVGTAALLEIARMMKLRSQPRNDMIFLITDGEELGLLGADKFVELHPWAKEIGVVINLEARGTTGPSLMFETSKNSRWLIDLFARVVDRPMGSSLFYEIYRFLPNDTDFTIFRQGKMQGYNFAFIGDVKNYHTLEDNFANVDRGSLQHHGQNAWALIRELVEIDVDEMIQQSPQTGNAVYFDVLGWFVVWWPEAWSLLLSAIAFAAILTTVLIRSRFDMPLFGRLIKSILMVLITMVVVALLVWFTSTLFSMDQRFENPWIQSPLPVELACWFVATTGAAILVRFLPPLHASRPTWLASMLVWCGLAFATSYWIAGASYLFLVPVVFASLIGLVTCWRQDDSHVVLVLFAVLVAFFWLPNERLFYDAVGFRLHIALAIRISIVIVALLPVLSYAGERSITRFGWLSFVGFLATLMGAIFLNPVT